MKNSNKYTTVSIPTPLNAKVQELIKDTGFSSTSGFVSYILRQLVSDAGTKGFSKKDEQKVKERLRSLGYLK